MIFPFILKKSVLATVSAHSFFVKPQKTKTFKSTKIRLSLLLLVGATAIAVPGLHPFSVMLRVVSFIYPAANIMIIK
jgi:hypothetical protein